MHGGRKHGLEIYGVISPRRPRHTRGCSAKEEEEKKNIYILSCVFTFPNLIFLIRSYFLITVISLFVVLFKNVAPLNGEDLLYIFLIFSMCPLSVHLILLYFITHW